jgi:hypothetical protein
LNLLQNIFPELKNVSIKEIQDLVRFIPQFPKDSPTIAELLELFPKFSLQQVQELCEYLKLSNKEKEFACFYQHTKNLLNMPEEWLQKLEKAEWAHFYANPHAELCIKITASHYPSEKKHEFIAEHSKRRQLLKKAIERIQSKDPVVKAQHLIDRGIAPSEKMGKILKEAERISINNNLEDPSAIISNLLSGINDDTTH